MKHTGSTYCKWFLFVSRSNTWMRKAQDLFRFEKSCQKWHKFVYNHILCISHSHVWLWNRQVPLPFLDYLGIFGCFWKNEKHRMYFKTFFQQVLPVFVTLFNNSNETNRINLQLLLTCTYMYKYEINRTKFEQIIKFTKRNCNPTPSTAHKQLYAATQ